MVLTIITKRSTMMTNRVTVMSKQKNVYTKYYTPYHCIQYNIQAFQDFTSVVIGILQS